MVTFVKPKFKFWNFPFRRDEIHSHQCQRKMNQRNFHCTQIFILPCPSPSWKTWFSEGLQSKPPRIYFLSLKKSEDGLWASTPRDQYNHILQWRSLINKTAKKHLSSINAILREGNGTPLSTLAWKIPWMEEPGGLQSMGSLRVRHDWAASLSLFTSTHWRRKWQPTPVFLPGESQGWGNLVGCRLWGRTESDTTEVT